MHWRRGDAGGPSGRVRPAGSARGRPRRALHRSAPPGGAGAPALSPGDRRVARRLVRPRSGEPRRVPAGLPRPHGRVPGERGATLRVARTGDPAGWRGASRRHAHPAADRRTRDPVATVGRELRPVGLTAPRARVDSTGPTVLTRITTRKEGCTMAETALTVLPHPSGIGRQPDRRRRRRPPTGWPVFFPCH